MHSKAFSDSSVLIPHQIPFTFSRSLMSSENGVTLRLMMEGRLKTFQTTFSTSASQT
ncbi:hypothetical protein HMPREF3156_01408 [Neisseria sp. HMSC06F02]|nr:hypothetical protein HMPREF3156_01408 [Neisseria sp. HMSC06F02]